MLLMLGTLIRAKVPLFQKLLFPSSLIGGLIGFVLINLDLVGMPTSTGWKDITPNIFSMITFHLFAFGFVGIGLLQTKKPASGKVVMRGALWIALVFGMTFSVQALIGKGVFVLWQDLFGARLKPSNGYLLGAGFTQAPGQTQAYATIWQTSSDRQRPERRAGLRRRRFLVAGIVGVPLAFYGIIARLVHRRAFRRAAPELPARPYWIAATIPCSHTHHPPRQSTTSASMCGPHGGDLWRGLSFRAVVLQVHARRHRGSVSA
ncbi:MAG: hypothetical protein ACLRWP_11090 [Bilophila wadsworthia]